MITEAIILAGGLGTRLRSVVADVPKCMAPVNGIPFISYIITGLQKQGITRFIFSLGYKSEIVIEYLDAHFDSLEKAYIIEEEPLGTGGAIKEACHYAEDENVLIFNGDTLFDIDLEKFSAFHLQQQAVCSLALKPMTNFSRYGAVDIDASHTVTAFHEKQFCESGLINGGIYALQVKAIAAAPLPEKFSFEKDFLEKNTGTGNLSALAFDNYFIDIGIPEDYERANRELSMNNEQ
jgi:D-glycero-alpha-D-manno-heptose 1-phosphate guanylyltransferase